MADFHQSPASARDEKLSALAALVGPATLERLRRTGLVDVVGDKDKPLHPEPGANVAPDRLAWHQNRLLQRLRARLDTPVEALEAASAPAPSARPVPMAGVPCSGAGRIDARIARALDPERLADEHPAVLAHILSGMDRAARVEMLRSLPGHAARAAIRRLRDGSTDG